MKCDFCNNQAVVFGTSKGVTFYVFSDHAATITDAVLRPIPKTTFKICRRCNKLKAISDFYSDGTYKGQKRYRADCKNCCNDDRREMAIMLARRNTDEC